MVTVRCLQVKLQRKTPNFFSAVKRRLILKYEAEKSTYLLIELDVRKPLVIGGI